MPLAMLWPLAILFATLGSRAALAWSIDLTNHANVQYSGFLFIGQPRQRVRVLFDTGSSTSWLHLKSALSRSFAALPAFGNISSKFGGGAELRGTVASDWCSLSAGGTAFRLVFGVVQERRGLVFETPHFGGLIGLGLGSQSAHSFLDALFSQLGMQQQTVSFFLSKQPARLSALSIGEPPNPRYFHAPLHFVPLAALDEWQVRLTALIVMDARSGNRTRIQTAMHALIDTGSSLCLGPPDSIAMLQRVIGLRADCSNWKTRPAVAFHFGSLRLVLGICDRFLVSFCDWVYPHCPLIQY